MTGRDGVAQPKGPHGVVRRAAAVLRTLADADSRGLSASEAARRTGIALQTVHRILGELAEEGLTLQDPVAKTWTLGPELLALGALAARQVNWIERARDVLRAVTVETQETAIMTARTGAYGTIVDLVESPQPLRLTERVGLRLPLSVGASRRAILAALNPTEREAVLGELQADGVPVDRAAVEADCARIAAEGCAVSGGEVTPHTVGVAVPVVAAGRPVGSIMVAGPVHRMGQDAVARFHGVLARRVPEVAQLWDALPRITQPAT